MHRGVLVTLTVLIARTPMPVTAQATTAILHGVVTSAEQDAPLAAWVEVRNLESGATRRVRTDSRGAYRLLGLSPGAHDVVATSLGYRPQRRASVQLVLGERSRADFKLTRAIAELEPTVITAAATLETDRLNVSTPVLEK